MGNFAVHLSATLADVLLGLSPRLFHKALISRLQKRNPELIAATFNKPVKEWGSLRFPTEIAGFEDLTFLFWSTNVSRGILRQDYDEAAALFKAVRGLRAERGVEIGRFLGGSTVLIAAALPATGRLLSIDLCPRDDAALQQALDRLGLLSRVELKVGDANAVPISESYDFAFVDGDHSYEGAKKDHLKWGAAVRPGGLVIHHDMGCSRRFASQIAELKRLRDDILRAQAGAVAVQEEAGSLVVFRKLSDQWPAF